MYKQYLWLREDRITTHHWPKIIGLFQPISYQGSRVSCQLSGILSAAYQGYSKLNQKVKEGHMVP